MGSSAGGHLASTIATHTRPELRPNFQILFYPVITMDKSYTHIGSHDNLLGKDAFANPESMVRIKGYLEPSLRDVPVGQAVQFERVGYFCPDTDSTPEHLVFNRTVTLKDSWAKINK